LLARAVLLTPFAFDALVIGIADEVADIDHASRHTLILAEGIAIPVGHVAVAEHGAAGGRDGRQAIEVVARVPAAEVNHLNGVQGDELPVNLVDVAGHDPLCVRHNADAVGAQQPDFAWDAASIASQEPVSVAVQLQRADSLLQQLEAAGQRIGPAEQLLQRVIGDADALFALQPEDAQGHQRARFHDAVDGDVDPGRLLVDTVGVDLDGRAELEAAARRDRLEVRGARTQLSAAIAEKVAKPSEHGGLL